MAVPTSVNENQLERLSRYGDFRTMQGSALAPADSQFAGFFDGTVVDKRMDTMRSEIEYIRRNWAQYAKFSSELREYLIRKYEGKEQDEFGKAVQAICGEERSWADQSVHYPSLRVYASTLGYNELFSISSKALRDESLITDSQAVRSNAFLTELLNIDLFRLHETNERARNFSGIVYRGLVVNSEQLEQLRGLTNKDIRHRVLAIPLATISATRDIDVIWELFNLHNAGKSPRDLVVLRIHVETLDAAFLQLYQTHFPNSVVTSLCAVPIDELSPYPAEGEVVLRGPWFQVLCLQEQKFETFPQINVMDVVMMSCNRDHPSTMKLEQPNYALAREFFRCITWISRCTKCKKLADEYELLNDVVAFEDVISEERLKMKQCLDEIEAIK